jgi:hypothetical protein
MSPRAASRLESIGFEQVYDYSAGKADWGSFGLPLDGHATSGTRVGAHLGTDVPTCWLEVGCRSSAGASTRAAGRPASSSATRACCSAGSDELRSEADKM